MGKIILYVALLGLFSGCATMSREIENSETPPTKDSPIFSAPKPFVRLTPATKFRVDESSSLLRTRVNTGGFLSEVFFSDDPKAAVLEVVFVSAQQRITALGFALLESYEITAVLTIDGKAHRLHAVASKTAMLATDMRVVVERAVADLAAQADRLLKERP